MRTISVVAAAFIVQKRLLLVRKRNTLKFMLPGGKVDMGESDLDCLKREVLEELGCELDTVEQSFLGEFTAEAANEPTTQVIARVYVGRLLDQPKPQQEIDELLWYSGEDDCSVPVAPLIKEWVLPQLLEMKYL